MTEQGRENGGRRRKRFLSPSQKYEVWVGLLRGEATISEAADRAGVDRSTVMKLRQVAKAGALEALARRGPVSRPMASIPSWLRRGRRSPGSRRR
jgi:transposase-like protein